MKSLQEEIESYGQNYREQPSGNSFLRLFDARGGGERIRRLIQYRGEYIKSIREAFAEFAPEQPIGKEDPEVRSKITEAQKEILLDKLYILNGKLRKTPDLLV